MEQRTTIQNCHIYPRKMAFLAGPGADTPAMFTQSEKDPGALYVNMDGMLIVPLELFSERQLKALRKKLHEQQTPCESPSA